MSPVSPLSAIAALLVALTTCFALTRKFGPPPAQGRFASIDGLRGYLAFFVFLHHSSIWYFFLKTGRWTAPPSNLYNHFGQTSVALFFMISGFLFFSKILDGRKTGIDWLQIYVSRLLRLVPLYLFLMTLLFGVVAYLSGGQLREPLQVVVSELWTWICFTVGGYPDINGVEHTKVLVAGVTWSLPYEWCFYLSLPLLALTVGAVAPLPYILLSVAGIIGLVFFWEPFTGNLTFFAGGIAASFFARYPVFRKWAATPVASLVVILSIGTTVSAFGTVYGSNLPLFLLSTAFILIASGNNLFGALTSSLSRALGELAYSIYLLHGIMLFGLFVFVIDIQEARTLSPLAHWLIIVGATPMLILGSYLTFRFIERPAMQSTGRVVAWLRPNLSATRLAAKQAA